MHTTDMKHTSEANASELPKNLEEMFPRNNMYTDVTHTIVQPVLTVVI